MIDSSGIELAQCSSILNLSSRTFCLQVDAKKPNELFTQENDMEVETFITSIDEEFGPLRQASPKTLRLTVNMMKLVNFDHQLNF